MQCFMQPYRHSFGCVWSWPCCSEKQTSGISGHAVLQWNVQYLQSVDWDFTTRLIRLDMKAWTPAERAKVALKQHLTHHYVCHKLGYLLQTQSYFDHLLISIQVARVGWSTSILCTTWYLAKKCNHCLFSRFDGESVPVLCCCLKGNWD